MARAEAIVAETGKTLIGRTITVRCQWKNEDGERCSQTRTIRPQDQHQVKFCVTHQKLHRRAIRSAKRKRRRYLYNRSSAG